MEIQGIHLQNMQTVHAAQFKRKEKWAKDLNGHFSKEGIQRRHPGHKVHEKMLSIPNHQRNANQRYTEVSLLTSQHGHLKNLTINAGGGVERREPSFPVGRNINQCIHSGGAFRHSTTKYHVTQPSHTWVWILGKPNFQKIQHTNHHGITGYNHQYTKETSVQKTDEWLKKMGFRYRGITSQKR